MRRIHFVVGLIGVFVFLMTGAYMRARFPELYGANEALRFMYRANHVYLLLASLVNVVLGIYLVEPDSGWQSKLTRIGSVLAALSPIVFCYAFFAEAPRATPERVFTLLGTVLLSFGVLFHVPNALARVVQDAKRA